ncbi:unnamed protein product [Moneuplotes crassus]|uniref:Serine hydrolase domain-containing protein n=1 Tax=Euplotes crassus TaxID=5936 RepID=A0AAD1XRA8_EUPCR|nr:unnamed protein product [Moneuplotes crassus]
MEANKKLKILCLHGYFNNKEILKKHVEYYQFIFIDYVEFHYLNGPIKLDSSLANPMLLKMFNPPFYCWTTTEKMDTAEEEDEIRSSYKYLYDYIEENGPFDGCISFSQGTYFSKLINNTNWTDLPSLTHPFRFQILATPKYPPNFFLKDLSLQAPSLPTLYIFDPSDPFSPTFPISHSTNPYSTTIHHKGHSLPKFTVKYFKIFFNFLNSQYKSRFQNGKLGEGLSDFCVEFWSDCGVGEMVLDFEVTEEFWRNLERCRGMISKV